MKERIKHTLPKSCRLRLEVQGYENFSDDELQSYRFGIRFAYAICAVFIALGLVLNNLSLFIIAAVIAFGGVFPPFHPIDYLYNYSVRYILKKPRIPHRPNQGRFACMLATIWLIATIYFFYNNLLIAGYIFGTIQLSLATLVSTTDICIPSIIYNALFKLKQIK